MRADSGLGLSTSVEPVMRIMSLFFGPPLLTGRTGRGSKYSTCARWHSRLLTPHVPQHETLAIIGASNLTPSMMPWSIRREQRHLPSGHLVGFSPQSSAESPENDDHLPFAQGPRPAQPGKLTDNLPPLQCLVQVTPTPTHAVLLCCCLLLRYHILAKSPSHTQCDEG